MLQYTIHPRIWSDRTSDFGLCHSKCADESFFLYITAYLPLFTTFVVEVLVASIAVPGVPSLIKNLALRYAVGI